MKPPHPSRSPFGPLLLSVAILATGIVLVLGFRLLAARRAEAEGLAWIQSRNLAQALDQSLTGTLQRIDLALGSVVGQMEAAPTGKPDLAGVDRFLAMEGRLLPWPGIIWVANAQGRAILGNRPISTVPDWEPRWWFRHCRDHPDAGLVISKPIIGFYTGKWVIPCVRRYNRPDGGFAGVVVIPLSVEYLQTLLAGYEVGAGGTLTLRDDDGGYIARYPKVMNGKEIEMGKPIGSPGLLRFVQSGAREGVHFAVSAADGVPRLFANRRVAGAPLIVGAGLAEADYLAPWRQDRARILLAMGLSLIGIWTAAGLFWRSWRNQLRNATALAQSEERFRLAMDATRDGIWDWNVRTGEVYFSPSYAEMLGYDARELAARADSWMDLIHPEDRARVLAVNEECIQGPRPSFEVEYRMKARDGSLRWILGRGKAIQRDDQGRALRLVGTHVDVTDQKQTEQALREGEERYRTLFNNAEVGMFRTRLDGSEVLAFNDKYLSLIGRPLDAVLHQPSTLVWADPSAREAMVRQLKADGQVHDWPMQVVTSSGTILDCITSIKLFREEGILEGSILDITEKKRAEAENARLQAHLHQAQKMDSLGTLAGGIAHDMNNVLGGILGMAEIGQEDQPPDSPAHRAFGTIIRAAERAGKMVRSLLSFARQGPAGVEELDMNEILQEEVSLLERTTLARVRLDLDLATDLQPIRGDASTLVHAFMNLCVNALDAMPDQGTLTLGTRNAEPGWIEVTVADTGVGMSPEVLAKAVDPFFTTKEVGKGTGLGLSIVYSTVKAHRGRMEIQSEPGHGTRVTVRFPASLPVPRISEPPAPPPVPEPAAAHLEVLLVDDDEIPRETTGEVLERMGHGVQAAASGEDALARIRAGYRPDVVILDINMPGLGGVGTLPILRGLLPDVPVLIATGRADQAALELAHSQPNVSLLPKPFTIKELRLRLAKLGPGR